MGQSSQWERDLLAIYATKGTGMDIGCGTNKIGAFGVDSDPKCKPDLVADAAKVAWPDGQQDYIVSCHCLEHCGDVVETLREWNRLLRQYGTLAIIVPDGNQVETETLGDSEGMHKQLLSKGGIQKFLVYCGFIVEEIALIGKVIFVLARKVKSVPNNK